MQATENSFRSFTYDEELQRARWFKEDLDKGGWSEAYKGPGSSYWIKTFQEEEVPIKTLFTFEMPMPAESFVKLLHPSTQEFRNKWDESFTDHTTLEAYPENGGHVTFMRLQTSWPLTDRDFVLFLPPTKEVDWYGKQSLIFIQKNATHPSKPKNEDGFVRAINGGNFFIVTPDDKEPEAACKVFGLTNNNYNGWLPKTNLEWLLSRLVPRSFNKLRENMISGYRKYFEKVQD